MNETENNHDKAIQLGRTKSNDVQCHLGRRGGPNNAVIAWFREFVISRHFALGSFPSGWMVLERKRRRQDIDLLAFLCPTGSLPVASAFNLASRRSLGLLWLFLDDKTQNTKPKRRRETWDCLPASFNRFLAGRRLEMKFFYWRRVFGNEELFKGQQIVVGSRFRSLPTSVALYFLFVYTCFSAVTFLFLHSGKGINTNYYH